MTTTRPDTPRCLGCGTRHAIFCGYCKALRFRLQVSHHEACTAPLPPDDAARRDDRIKRYRDRADRRLPLFHDAA